MAQKERNIETNKIRAGKASLESVNTIYKKIYNNLML